MRVVSRSWGLGLVGACVFALGIPVANAAKLDLFTSLSGSSAYPRAIGNAEYERSATDRELKVTVRNVARLAGKQIVVSVNGRKVGMMLVTRAGRAHREWKSEHGQYVPVASVKSSLWVHTTAGRLIVSGRLRVDVAD